MASSWVPPSSSVDHDRSDVHTSALYPRIIGFRLGLYSPEEIARMATAQLTEHQVYAKNLPRLGGPIDPGLGPSDRRVRCPVCRNSWHACPGHTGMIRLPIALYHVGHIDTVYKLVQCTCWNCSKPLGDPEDIQAVADARPQVKFTRVFVLGRGRFVCRNPACNAPQPKYSRRKYSAVIVRTWKPRQLEQLAELSQTMYEASQRPFTPTEALDIMRNMADEDVRAMGFDPRTSHPAWLILQNLAALPSNARPAIMASEGSKRRGQDDITNQMQEIIKSARALRAAIAATRRRGGGGGGGESASASASKSKAKPKAKAKPKSKAAAAAKAKAKSKSLSVLPDFEEEDARRLEAVAEFAAQTEYAADLSPEEVVALDYANADTHFQTLSVTQAAQAWTLHAAKCEKLQNDVTVLFDNGGRHAPQAKQRTGAPKKAMFGRITGKQGRMRGNMVAKRVDQTARTVITPDSTIDVDQLGVPGMFMDVLTTPEEVNERNIDALRDAVRRGPGVENGAARVLHVGGQLVQLHLVEDREGVVLQKGDIVERHLRTGDRGVFNRQPSLHRLSLMSHRLVRVPGKAFRVSLGVMGPYNADCDGDEMNLLIMQSLEAQAEQIHLMAVSRNVMNPQNNRPCLSLVQDARVGIMLLTQAATRLDVDLMHQCVSAIRYPQPGKEGLPPPHETAPDGQPLWTGKQLVTMLLPPVFLERYVRGADPATCGPDDPEERYVLIENGVLKHGALCKDTVGTGSSGLISRILTSCGDEAVVRFISDAQRVVNTWLQHRGLTFGLRDAMVSPDTQRKIDAVTEEVDALVHELTREADAVGKHLTAVEAARVESYVLTILTSVLDYTSRLVIVERDVLHGAVTDPHGFRSMVAAASKGGKNNLAQVMACLGQQVVDGDRINPSAVTRRTLPMFPRGAFHAAARGFISRAYLKGMRPYEYFFHMMAGREGLVSTAVKTADTGYKYRSMAKGEENDIIQWDGTTRNGQDIVLEFVAGGDYMDPTKVERVQLHVLEYGDAHIAEECGHLPPLVERVLRLRDDLRSALLTPLYARVDTRLLLPFNATDEARTVAWELAHRRARFADDSAPSSDAELFGAVEECVARLLAHLPSPEAGVALELSVRFDCRPRALRALGVNAHVFRHQLAPLFLQRLQLALAQPGTAAGVLAAQSIGEPATQFTLNVFHFAGMMMRRMTVGVPRLKELLHASVDIRTPSMVIPFRNEAALSDKQARRKARSLQFLCIDAILHSSYPQYDPPGDGVSAPVTHMYKDVQLVQHVVSLYGPETGAALSPWIVRLVLNRAMLSDLDFTPETVARAIVQQLEEYDLVAVYSQPNMAQWVIRLRIDGDTSERAARELHGLIRDRVWLGGVDGIRESTMITAKHTVEDPATRRLVETTRRVIDTNGSALMKIATRDWADWENTVTNNVAEVHQTLGLAAARAVLFAELDRVISYDGGYVDARHLRHVVNAMTCRGFIMPMTRHGINRVDFSVLQRASYEEPVDMILQAARNAELDPLRGMCECVAFGQKPPVGTGTVAVQVDVEGRAHRNLVSSRELDGHRGRRKQFRPSVRLPEDGAAAIPGGAHVQAAWREPAPELPVKPEAGGAGGAAGAGEAPPRARRRAIRRGDAGIVVTGSRGEQLDVKPRIGVDCLPPHPSDEPERAGEALEPSSPSALLRRQ